MFSWVRLWVCGFEHQQINHLEIIIAAANVNRSIYGNREQGLEPAIKTTHFISGAFAFSRQPPDTPHIIPSVPGNIRLVESPPGMASDNFPLSGLRRCHDREFEPRIWGRIAFARIGAFSVLQ